MDWPRTGWRRRLSWSSIRLWNSRQRCATVTPQTASTRCCSRQAAARTTPHAERDHAHARLLPRHGGPGGEQDADGSRRDESRSRALSVSSRRLCADETTTKNPHPLRRGQSVRPRIRRRRRRPRGGAGNGAGAGRRRAFAGAPRRRKWGRRCDQPAWTTRTAKAGRRAVRPRAGFGPQDSEPRSDTPSLPQPGRKQVEATASSDDGHGACLRIRATAA